MGCVRGELCDYVIIICLSFAPEGNVIFENKRVCSLLWVETLSLFSKAVLHINILTKIAQNRVVTAFFMRPAET